MDVVIKPTRRASRILHKKYKKKKNVDNEEGYIG